MTVTAFTSTIRGRSVRFELQPIGEDLLAIWRVTCNSQYALFTTEEFQKHGAWWLRRMCGLDVPDRLPIRLPRYERSLS